MSFWDQFGNGLLGAAGGYLGSGDLSGLLGGGLAGGFLGQNQPLNLQSGLQDAFMGAGAGQLSSNIFGGLDPSILSGQSGSGWNLGNWGNIGQYLPSLPSLGGLFGGGGGGSQPSQPQNPFSQWQGGGSPSTQNPGAQAPQQGGQGMSPMQMAALAAGLGLVGGGLANTPNIDLTSVFNGQPQQTNNMIQGQINQQSPEFQQYLQQLQQSRGQGAQSLDQTLFGNSQQQMSDMIRQNAGQLNAMGLMNGPSGAMDEALARSAQLIKQQAMPYQAQYGMQTQGLMDQANQNQLQNTLGLQNAGLGRNFSLQDQLTNATLKQNLLGAAQQQGQNQAMVGLGALGVGYGLGGTQGLQAAGGLANALKPNVNYGGFSNGYGNSGGYSNGGGGYGGGGIGGF